MKIPEVEIKPVESGDELIQAWQEMGYGLPSEYHWAWKQTVEGGFQGIFNTLLIARQSDRAIGAVAIRWAGPGEKPVRELLESRHTGNIPALNAVHVEEGSRRQGVGTALVAAAERSIAANPDAANRSVLWVLESNLRSQRFFEKIGYENLGLVVIENVPDENWKPLATAQGFVMSKDLSSLASEQS
jgi:GNAT superfamily N-acetyltransferase